MQEFCVTWSRILRRGYTIGVSEDSGAGIYKGMVLRAHSEDQAKGYAARRIKDRFGRNVFIEGLAAEPVQRSVSRASKQPAQLSFFPTLTSSTRAR